MAQHDPPHPGELLREHWLTPIGLTITETAAQLKVSRNTLSQIINCRAPVTAEMALRLEMAFGKSAASWLGHQSDYDLWRLRAKRRALGLKRLVSEPAVPRPKSIFQGSKKL